MENNIFIPKKINVGFQKRDDTYTKKLAYVTYFDQNNKLRKETSWNSWRDKNIDSKELDNIPISGFVLNKKAGGYGSGWNSRQTYCRVYDPRDFEFEISISNLIYILENTNSIKGKGLEGEFIYGWDGKDLLLMPIDSPDYKELLTYNSLIYKKEFVKAKDLTIGATYRHVNNSKLIYMGRFEYFNEWNRNNEGLRYFFYDNNSLQTFKSISNKLIEIIDENCVENYADLFEKLEFNCCYSPIDQEKDEYIQYTFDEFCEMLKKPWGYGFYSKEKEYITRYRINKYNGLIRSDAVDKYYFRNQNDYETIENCFNRFKPMYKNEYLLSGKFYRSDK